mgnify:CR=1 FL=1
MNALGKLLTVFNDPDKPLRLGARDFLGGQSFARKLGDLVEQRGQAPRLYGVILTLGDDVGALPVVAAVEGHHHLAGLDAGEGAEAAGVGEHVEPLNAVHDVEDALRKWRRKQPKIKYVTAEYTRRWQWPEVVRPLAARLKKILAEFNGPRRLDTI